MRPLTIVHTEASLGWGGQEIRIFTEMQAMRSRGHRLLLAAQPSSRIYQKSLENGFEVFPFTEKSLLFPVSILRLAGWFRKNSVDVVNTHSSKDGWIGGIAARLAGVPCVIRSKHIDVDYPRKFSSRIAYGVLPHIRSKHIDVDYPRKFSSRIAYGVLPHHVLTTSLKIKEKISCELSIPPTRISNMPTGIDPALFQGQDAILKKELDLPETTSLIGMISVIRSWKGHRFFLEAAASLMDKFPDARFVIAGDGPGLERLRDTIREPLYRNRVYSLGHRQDVASLLKSLDVLVLPSTAHEGVPQIILQAQFSQCPVVATTVGGIPEVIEDGISGALVPPSDSAALVLAISTALEQKEQTRIMADNAHARAMKNHTLQMMCKRTEEIYQKFLL